MTDRMVTLEVELPLSTYRALQRAAERRKTTPKLVAGQVLTSRLEPTVAAKRQILRRQQVAKFIDLHYSAAEIAARVGCSEATARADMRTIRATRKA